jgi:hypothetical protein
MHRERHGCDIRLLVSGCKDHQRAHPNMMSVHSLQESSSIDLLEVGMGGGQSCRIHGLPAQQIDHVKELQDAGHGRQRLA